MEKYRVVGTRRSRRRAAVVTALGAAVFAIGSVAWACTLQIGTLTVCNPPSAVYVNGQCAQKTGSGGQVGLVKINTASTKISVMGQNFNNAPYSVLLRQPGSTASCHNHLGTGVHSLLGYNPNGTPKTVPGWTGNLKLFVVTPDTPTLGATGGALLCVQDEPGRVTGNQVTVAVI